jgi:vacuolar iron transporter family protein
MEPAEARRVADALMQDPARARHAGARGTRPQSGRTRLALGRGDLFVRRLHRRRRAAAAAFPVRPRRRAAASVTLTALGLFAVGASMSLFTGRHALLSGLRMLGIGGAAGLATYFIGAWLGVSLG